MASRFQEASLVTSPSYPNAVAWSSENLIAVAAGHLVIILVSFPLELNLESPFFKKKLNCDLVRIRHCQVDLVGWSQSLTRSLIRLARFAMKVCSFNFPPIIVKILILPYGCCAVDLLSGGLLPSSLKRERHPSVRSLSWSHLGMSQNYGYYYYYYPYLYSRFDSPNSFLSLVSNNSASQLLTGCLLSRRQG